MSRHALPWSLWRMVIDSEAHHVSRGRHRRNVSPTHVPAWPFNKVTS